MKLSNDINNHQKNPAICLHLENCIMYHAFFVTSVPVMLSYVERVLKCSRAGAKIAVFKLSVFGPL